jgi:hypothetical protein
MGSGTAQQAKLDGEISVSYVAAVSCRDWHSEAALPLQGVLLDPLHPRPEWSALDSEASVMGSLLALNAHLMFYDRVERVSLARN